MSLSPSSLIVDAVLGVSPTDASDGDNGAVPATVGGTGSSASETCPAGTADNPWEYTPVVVGINMPADSHDYASLVESVTDYWRTNASAVIYDSASIAKPNNSDPGVTVSVVERVDGCSDDTDVDAIGCASLLDGNGSTTLTEPVTVVITVGYDDEMTQMVLKHKFGHLLGLTYDGADAFPVLSERVETTRLPKSDAGGRESSFRE